MQHTLTSYCMPINIRLSSSLAGSSRTSLQAREQMAHNQQQQTEACNIRQRQQAQLALLDSTAAAHLLIGSCFWGVQ